MTPLHYWLAVKRDRTITGPIWLPEMPRLDSCVGQVEAAGFGRAHKRGLIPLECKPGDRILYSSRVDTYRVGDSEVDIVDEQSVIGWV